MTTAFDAVLDALRSDAANGGPDALFRLATALVAREEVDEAHGFFTIAAQRDHAGAQVGLARMLLYGVGAQLDVAAAVHWLLRAERAGHGGASYLLAMVALGDIAMERDFEATGHRLIEAAKDGVVPALRALAMYFGRERDNIAAMRQSETLLAQAAGQGDGVSAALLAERIRHGELVGDVRYELAALLALAAQTGITAMPSLPDAAVTRNGDGRLQLDLESSLWAPPMTMHRQAPWVGNIDGLLSPEECRYVIAMGSPQLKRASVVDPRTGVRMEHPMRTSRDATFDPLLEDFQLRLLQLRMAGAIGVEFTHSEPMVLLHYQPGQEYRPHRDYLPPATLADDQPGAGQRAATLCCYLSGVEAGGGTAFPAADLVVDPRIGRAVIFRNTDEDGRPDPDSLHAGLPVEKGEKWLATLWLRQRRYRDF